MMSVEPRRLQVKEAILKVLEQLDPANGEHWTKEGLPLLDAVNALLEVKVDRATLNANLFGFNRETAIEMKAARDAANGETQDSIDKARDLDDILGGSDQPPAVEPEVNLVAAVDIKAEMDAKVQAARQALEDHELAMAKAHQLRDALAKEVLKAEQAKRLAFPGMNQSEATQVWLKQQSEARRQRHGVHTGVVRSQIDRAMARSTGYGGRRPRVPLLVG
jgi:hypothetical protein